MKRASRKKSAPTKTEPTVDQLQDFMAAMYAEHEVEFCGELHSSAPHWEYLLALHMRMVELEQLESASAELL